MRWLGWFRRAPQEADTDTPAPHRPRWSWVGGRRVLAESAYIMPKDAEEGNRLDLQHYVFKLALGGNYRAPLRQPKAILDVACGTGIWCRELAQEFPRARVVGLDIDRTPMEASLERLGPQGLFPRNFEFLEADALKPLPFEDATFDVTHSRAISGFIPIARWPAFVAELVRVTKPGGYVVVVDVEIPSSASPAATRLLEASKQLMQGRALHLGAGPSLAGYLRQAGLIRVQERHVMGGSGRQKERQQRLLAADLIGGFSIMEPILLKIGAFASSQEYQATVAQAKRELPDSGATLPIYSVYGMRPLPGTA